ncbi:CusA/CzcA family heavy metal efflux RND transporter [Roseomonas hellenica]|uniref:CusA/CzcA family heavy metal efflux RND transporter n=1 Tax=Plastoroseomonas hellenica TaxID=2687306 RepID=A0ABS5EVB0_9PROT|nr:CusA/CzcA family heavy metal efflux RND transporter [Plastoroseomonas hellenica]MBR0664219.1 CusA/CzcA family heavy metal efflux RND transporter [Plastoroseomonas hellenica]
MIERIIEASIRRRWLVVFLTLAAAAFGAWGLQRLPIDAVPDITNVQVQVNTVAPALSPEQIEKQVTFPVETALAGIPGLESTRSMSRNGFSQVTAVFRDGTDIYFARQQVAERLRDAEESLPPGAEPRMGPVSTGLGEVFMWTVEYAPEGDPARPAARDGQAGWQSDGSYLTPEGARLTDTAQRLAYLRTVQDWVVRPQIRNVPGVAGVDGIGGYVKQYQIRPDPQRLLGFGFTFRDLTEALERNNASIGAGYLDRNGEGYVVRSEARITSFEQIRDVVIATREGVPIRIRDVATVVQGQEMRVGSASRNGEEVVVGTALMLIGGNSRTVAAAVDAKMRDIQRALPPGIMARTVLDRTVLVDATIQTVGKNLAEGALLVIAVLFLMLGNIRTALITAAVIPITMLLTTTGMLEAGLSANLMSLGALDFGLIVDGAVIIAENSLRHVAEQQQHLGRTLTKRERLRTVTNSAVEMVRPSVFGQAIIILVYVPMLSFTGIEEKMFAPMALTVMIALAGAFVMSLTFVPAAIAIAITGRVKEEENWLVRGIKRSYAPALRRSARMPMPFILGAALLFGLSLALFTRLGQEFIPTLDERNLAMHALRIPSTSLSQSQAMQTQVERVVSRFPEVAYVFSKTGTAEVATDPMPPNVSDTFIMLRPRAAWPDPSMTTEALVRRIGEAVNRVPGHAYEFTQPIQMRFNELIAGVRSDLAVKVFGDEFEPMLAAANRIAAILRGIEGAADVRVEQASGLPFLDIRIDREAAARRGLAIADVQEVVAIAIGGRAAGLVFEGDRRFQMVVRLPDAVRGDLEALRNLPVPLRGTATPGGGTRSVPLRDVASFAFTEGPNQVSRENGKRRVVVQANARGRDIGSLVAEVQARVAAEVQLPTGYWIEWGGQFENLAAARQRLMIVVPVVFAAILALLYGALGSLRDAVLVYSGVPLALSGGILALWLRGMPFSVTAAVGFIALSGVAVLNGLVMVTRIRQLMAEGMAQREAILEGAMTRLRPVVMTALVASLGFVPMAIATGTGAEVQKPLATVVIGGLISATVLTLLVLPALYARFGSRTVLPPGDDGETPDEAPAPPAGRSEAPARSPALAK